MQVSIRSNVIVLGVLAIACTANADKASGATGESVANNPDARGRAVLEAQLAALGNDDAFIATFAKQATVLTPLGSAEVHAPNASVAEVTVQGWY